jgi:hypothetical protein
MRHAPAGFLRLMLYSNPRGHTTASTPETLGDWPDDIEYADDEMRVALYRLLGPGTCLVQRRGRPARSRGRGCSDVYQAWLDWSAALGAACPSPDLGLEKRVVQEELGGAVRARSLPEGQ